jgi:hypothetical protein
MTSFVVQVDGNLPPNALDRDGSVRRHTVLQTTVRDQAALYGLLKMLNDFGLELLDLHQLPGSEAGETPSLSGHGGPSMTEVVISGSIGDLVMSEISDHVEVTHLATRLLLADRRLLGQVLDWARNSGAAVEYAAEAPPPTSPSNTPPDPPRPSSPSSLVVGQTPAE